MKPIYFLSDAHLGSYGVKHGRTQERRLVRFLDSIKEKAGAVYLLGDMFDFWYEYKFVVPRGFTRFLGKLSELTDLGVEVHFFTGNHDIWAYSYLEQECGCIIHRKPQTLELGDSLFYLAHGDGLGDPNRTFKFLRWLFHYRPAQILFSAVHPRWGMDIGLRWSAHSRLKHETEEPPTYLGEDREHLVLFAKDYLRSHPDVNYFVFGHRHIELDLLLSHTTRLVILGDWISQFTFAVFDGHQLTMHNYIEGETQP